MERTRHRRPRVRLSDRCRQWAGVEQPGANAPIPATNALTAPGIPFGVYYVRIRATGAAGPGAASNEVIVTVGGCAGPPQDLVVASQSAGTIALTWSPPTSGESDLLCDHRGIRRWSVEHHHVRYSQPEHLGGRELGPRGVLLRACALAQQLRDECPVKRSAGVCGGLQRRRPGQRVVGRPSDVDLHVVEPSGEELYYAHPVSATGGQLDVDSNAGCGIDGRQIENIRWPGRAPGGTYTVRVDYWNSCGVGRTNYLVTVTERVTTQTIPDFFTGPGDEGGEGSGVTIGTFVHAADERTASDQPFFPAPALFTPSPIKLRSGR